MNEDVEQSIFCLSVITTDGQKKFTISSVKMFIHRAVGSDGRASFFRASGRLEPSVFWDFGLRVGSGSAKFASGGQVFMYIQEPKILGVFVSDVRASGFRASGGLEPSKNAFGRASGRS